MKNVIRIVSALNVLGVFLLSWFALAAPASLTYQGRILKTDGTPLEYSNVSFIFQVTNPAGSCVIYQEQVTGYSMVNSGGVFDIAIGKGTVQYPLGGSFTILDTFNNSRSFTCGSCSVVGGNYVCVDGSGTYTPVADHDRLLRVQFYDGNGWKTISPDNVIRSVPFAAYALSAQKLGTNVASDFLTKVGLPTCGANTFLSWNGTALSCVPVSGASGGTVTSITAGAGLTGGIITTSGTIGLGTELSGVNSLSTTGFVKRTGAGAYSTSASISLTTDVTGVLPATSGGTGLSSLGTANQVVGVNNAGTAAEYKTITAGTGITVAQGAGVITINATGGNAITALTGDVTATGPGSVAATIANNAVTTPKLFTNPGINRLVATDATTGATLAPLSCASGQLLTWNTTSGWQCTNQSTVSSGTFSGSLSGDVTGTQSATVVSSVGGVTAANVASGANAANAATNANTVSTIVKRDASGNFSAGTITASLTGNVTGSASLNVLKAGDSMSGNLTFAANTGNVYTAGLGANTATVEGPSGAIGTSYVLRLPTAQGAANQFMANDGAGNLSWTSLSSLGVTSVSATSPLSSTGGSAPTISLAGLTGLGTANQILGMNSGATGYEYKTVNGTANQITVTNAANSITLATPQNIHAAATPTFAGLTLSNFITAGIVKNTAAGVLSGGNSVALTSDVSGILPVANGGTNASSFAAYSVIASNSTGAALAAVPGTVNGSILQYSATGPTWSTASYPSTTTANQLLYSSANNVVGGLATANSAVLTTSGTGVPSFSAISGDLFSQYALLAGRSGGQTLYGGTAASNTLTLAGTSNATAGNILLNPSGGNIGVGILAPSNTLSVSPVQYNTGTASQSTTTITGVGTTFTSAMVGSQFVFANGTSAGTITGFTSATSLTVSTSQAVASQGYTINYTGLNVTSSGNVGVGTTTPGTDYASAKTLHLKSAGRSSMVIESSSADIATLVLSSGAQDSVDEWHINAHSGTAGNKDLNFWNGANLVTFRQSGNVGIGTTTPSNKLHVAGSIRVDEAAVPLTFNETDQAAVAGKYWRVPLDGANLRFDADQVGDGNFTTYKTPLTLTAAGNVGIGTLSPSAPLHINGTSGPLLRIQGTSAQGNNWIYFNNNGTDLGYVGYGSGANKALDLINYQNDSLHLGTFNTVMMTFLPSGNVGIGTSAPGYKLDVQGGDINASGSVRSAGVALTSDIRFKKDITVLDNSLAKILKLRGVSYNWKTDEYPERNFNSRHQIGVIAQEVEKVFPELVDIDRNGYRSVNYPALVAPLIESTKEVYGMCKASDEKVEELQSRIRLLLENDKKRSREMASLRDEVNAKTAELEAENARLKARLEKIEKLLAP